MTTPRCTGPDCDRPAVRAERTLCASHYQQVVRGGELKPLRAYPKLARRRPATCTEPGCDKPHRGLGLCSTHYIREYRKTKPQPLRRKTPAKPASNLPEGWFKPSRTPRPPKPQATGEIALTTLEPLKITPAMAAAARRTLIDRGAHDLLDMLGLADVA